MDFNSNLNKLFTNYQNQQNYKKQKYDVNGDGKINSKDQTALNKEKTELLKNKNLLFDVNGDGQFTQADVDMFVKGDFDGDGETSALEEKFVKQYKNDLKSVFVKQKADFNLDDKQYFDGKLASGIKEGKFYRSGKLATGNFKGKYYVEGEPANGKYGLYLYQDGVKFTGVHTDGRYYCNGAVRAGFAQTRDDNMINVYKSGDLFATVEDNCKKEYPLLLNGSICFEGETIGAQTSFSSVVKLSKGDSVVINEDGTVVITHENGRKMYCTANGSTYIKSDEWNNFKESGESENKPNIKLNFNSLGDDLFKLSP